MRSRKKIRTFVMTLQKNETFVVRRRRRRFFGWCDACEREVKMYKPEDAAQIAEISTRKIYREIETGKIHFIELPKDSLLVCLDSLLRKETP